MGRRRRAIKEEERRGAKNGGSTKLSVVRGGHIRSTWEGGALGGVEEGWSAIVEKRGPSKQDHADSLVVVGAQQSQGGGVLSPAFNHKEEVWEEFTTRQGGAKGRWRRGNCVVLSVFESESFVCLIVLL